MHLLIITLLLRLLAINGTNDLHHSAKNCADIAQDKNAIDYPGQKPPGMTARIFAPGIVSSNLSEHSSPTFSPDGKLVLWTVMDKSYRGYLLEMEFENGSWSKPRRPSFSDSTADHYYPSFSIDGKKLFFSSRRKVPAGYGEGKDIRIWEVEKKAEGWGTPKPFDTIISKGQDFAHSITKNGTLYFSSSLGGGTGFNIRKAEKAGGRYLKPELLPFSINSVDYEEGPFIAPDESYLIFESQRPEGINGSLDLYISFRNKDGRWGMPINMGTKINSGAGERFARVSPDGKYLFFGSTRNMSADNWGMDIYWIDASVIDELKNDEISKTVIERRLGNELIEALNMNDVKRSSQLLDEWVSKYSFSLDGIVVYSSMLRKQKYYWKAQQLLIGNGSQWKNNATSICEMALVSFGLNKDDEARKLLAPLLEPGDQLRERFIYLSNSLLDMGMLNASDEYFEKAMALGAGSVPYYNRAGALALIGEKDRAFAALNKAVELGGYNLKRNYKSDPSLDSLKSDPRWKTLLEKLK